MTDSGEREALDAATIPPHMLADCPEPGCGSSLVLDGYYDRISHNADGTHTCHVRGGEQRLAERAAIDAAMDRLHSTHWDGSGCGTHDAGACSRCYGPSPADAREVAEDVIAATQPLLVRAAVDRALAEVEAKIAAWPRDVTGGAGCYNDALLDMRDLVATYAREQAER